MLSSAWGALACGPADYSFHYFNLFVPEWIFGEEYSPAFYTTDGYYSIWSEPDYKRANLEAWKALIGQQVEAPVLERILYNTYPEGLYDIERADLVREHLYKGGAGGAKAEAVKRYLLLALEMERLADRPVDSWGYGGQERMPQEEAQLLIGRIQEAMKREKVGELKDRYAFQLIKAYRYSGQPDLARAAYERHFATQDKLGLIGYWAMDHYAGLLLQDGQNGAGYYHFLKVFRDAPSRRHSAYYSLNIGTAADWDATYKRCKKKEDKALLHFIRGTKDGVLALEDMRAIFSLVGNHEWLKIVMSREINKLESDNLEYYSEQPIQDLMAKAKAGESLLKNADYDEYVGELLKFANTALINNPGDGFWLVAKGYLEFLSGQLDNAALTLERAKGLEKPFYRIQAEVLLAIQLLQAEEPLTVAQENLMAEQVVEIFEDERTQLYTDRNNQEFILDLLAARKEADGDALLARMLRREEFSTYRISPELSQIEDLLARVEADDFTLLELLALKHFVGNASPWYTFKVDRATAMGEIRGAVLEAKARVLMRDPARLAEASAIFEALPASFDFPLAHNPFNSSLNDCVHCGSNTNARQTRNEFVRKLAEIYEIAMQTGSATDYYLLGNAYYNMTYFGPAYYVMNYYRSGSSFDGFTDCSVALGFYQAAMEAAPDLELGAKACFMAAKAEQNNYILQRAANQPADEYWWGKWEISTWPESEGYYEDYLQEIARDGHRSYFEKLTAQYATTDFYKQAVRECSYLYYFVSN